MIRAGRPAALARPVLALACAAALSGCITLVPSTAPARLYRFEYAGSSSPPATAPAGQRTGVYLTGGSFPREAAADQILTITGERAAYIAETRWVAPAVVLWDQAVRQAFDAAPRVRLISRGEPIRGQLSLRLSVLTFETVYEAGRPVVHVRVRASLIGAVNRDIVSEQIFEARAPVQDDRVSAIVAGYDQAVGEVLNNLVSWADSQATHA